MTQGFFLNPTIIQELLVWKSNTSENLVVFEPIAQACARLGGLLSADDVNKAAQITRVMEEWCASGDFEEMLTEAGKKRVSIDISLGRESLARYSGSDSFVAGVPIDVVLSAFSALIRADLRARESRCSVRIDELFIWQAQMQEFNLHDVCLLILAACAGKNVMQTFDSLLAIKEQPGLLVNIDAESLWQDLPAQFVSGMRMFALSNFDSAETAFSLAIEREPRNPSCYIAMSLIHLMNRRSEAALRSIEQVENKTHSFLLSTLRQLIAVSLDGKNAEAWANDPVSTAAACFLFLRGRQIEQAVAAAQDHLNAFPEHVLPRALLVEANLFSVRESLFNDPPLPGAVSNELKDRLCGIANDLQKILEICRQEKLHCLESRMLINLTLVQLLRRDFQDAITSAALVLEYNPGKGAAKINLATAAIALGDLPRALRSLESMPADYAPRAKLLAAEAYYHSCSFDLCLDIWNRELPAQLDRLWKLRILLRLLEVYRLLRDSKNAQECVDDLLTQFQHEPETSFALGYELWQMNRFEDAIAALRRAKEFALPNLKKWIAWELGRIYFDAGQPLSATDEYVLVAEKSQDSIQSREFAVALFKSGLIPAAYERAKALREATGNVIPGITEIETDYLVRENRLQEAKKLLKLLSEKRPQSVLNRLAIVRICAALQEEEEAAEELEKVKGLNLSDEMQDQVDRMAADLEVVLAIKRKNK